MINACNIHVVYASCMSHNLSQTSKIGEYPQVTVVLDFRATQWCCPVGHVYKFDACKT